MCDNASNEEILNYLAEAKELIVNDKYKFIPRRKNLQSLTSVGLTIKDAKQYLLDLEVTSYYKGPKKDFDINRPGDIWEFKISILENPFYIKLKIDTDEGQTILKILGFHIDEYR